MDRVPSNLLARFILYYEEEEGEIAVAQRSCR